MKLKLMLSVTVLLVSVSGVYAELHDRGGGLIYDDALNVTWLQDANLPASVTFGVGGIGLWGPGKMNWDTAMAWINAMNTNNYLGYSEWRLPKTRPVNSVNFNYDWSYDGSTDRGYNISAPESPYPGSTGSEMAYLFYNSLGNIGQYDINGNYNNEGEWGLKNTGPFINMEAAAYWSLTEYAPDTDNAWFFDFYDAHQYDQPKENIHYYAWAVRDGDVIPHIHCVGTESELHDALNVASNNSTEDIIKIKQGTYNGNFVYASTEPYGVTIEGGYLPGCASRVVDSTNTVLDAQNVGRVLGLSAPDVAVDFSVDGLTIQNGSGNLDVNGAGLFALTNGTITLTNNTIHNNSTISYGGGIYFNSSGSVTLTNNTISDNSANLYGGGGFFNTSSNSATLTNNTIYNNNSYVGGGIYFQSSFSGSATLTNNTIYNNSAHDSGGGYFNIHSGTVTLTNNIISDNIVNTDGGGGYFFIWSGTVTLTNNTITNNSADLTGGGVYIILVDDGEDGAISNIYDNIIWNNGAGNEGGDLHIRNDSNKNLIPSTVNLFNNDFDYHPEGTGTYIQIPFPIDPNNLNNEDPLFVDAENYDYHLTKDSPCRDAGDNDAPELPDTDIDGELRILDGFVDIGADEYSAPPCRADFDDDKFVDDIDLNIFLIAMGEIDCTWWPILCVCDTDNDDDVDATDLAVLVAEFGRSDCP